MTSSNARFSIPAHIMARQVGEETVLLDLESGTYFGLDDVGARIWQLIESGRTIDEICHTMVDEYDVQRTDLERDTVALVGKLLDAKLIDKA